MTSWNDLPVEIIDKIMETRMSLMWRDVHRKMGRHGYKSIPGEHRNYLPCIVPGCKGNVRFSLQAHDFKQCARCCNKHSYRRSYKRDRLGLLDRLSGMRGAKCQSIVFWKQPLL